ncbi:MAG TPA: ABC transporter substrate-binding protein [Motilibacterales bacterium]|nr:ABC transporter substrate-binding protein [Motilibacterales bacterium]
MSKATTSAKVAALAAASALLLAACGGSDSGDAAASGGTGEATKGGTLTFLTVDEQFNHLDPQRNYTGEDIAITTAYLNRTLVQYALSPDDTEAGKLVPDMATDIGTPSEGGKIWTFTLRDGMKFEDGTPITCAEVAYGVSRTFATDIITDGPTYAISLLDIPKDDDGTSAYKGPYDGAGQELFDKAVACSEDNKTITFTLANPAADFNYTTTLTAFSPVPKAADTGEKYDDVVVSSGPYKVEEYTKGTSLTLVRNDQWDQATDDYRKAYPDKVEFKFAVPLSVSSQRLIADSGADQATTTRGLTIDPAQLAVVFNDPKFENRRFDAYDPYVRYWAINTKKVPELAHRQALAAAFPRADLLTIAGGTFAGDLADGVIKPNLAIDYAPSGMWTDLLGQAIPDNGDPEYAKKLVADSGKPMPDLTLDYPKTEVNDKAAGAIVSGLEKAGIAITPNPIDPGGYYGIVQDEDKAGSLISGGWGPDWLNASTVIPELFTPNGGFNLSLWDDAEFTKASDDAKLIADRTAQGEAWAALNKQAMTDVLAIPTRFGKMQGLVGSKVGGAYPWAPYGSWPYAALYAVQ